MGDVFAFGNNTPSVFRFESFGITFSSELRTLIRGGFGISSSSCLALDDMLRFGGFTLKVLPFLFGELLSLVDDRSRVN